jgi:hypothetical protein
VRRTDYNRCRREGIRGPTVPYLILSDIKRLNLPVEDADYSKHTSNVFFPNVTGGYRECRRCVGIVADGSDTELCTYG